MISYNKIILFTALIFASIQLISATDPPECPDYEQKANFSDPAVLWQEQEKLWSKLWSMRDPKITRNIARARNYLRQMTYSGNDLWRKYAFLSAQWFWFLAPLLKINPNLCPFAKIINETVDFAKTKNCESLKGSIIGAMATNGELSFLNFDNVAKRIGCGPFQDNLQKSNPDCPEKGFRYKLKELWSLEGAQFPRGLLRVIQDLGRSNNPLDKLMRLCLVANLSPHFRALIDGLPYNLKHKFFYILTTTKIPKGCCQDFKDQCLSAADQLKELSGKGLEAIMKKAGC